MKRILTLAVLTLGPGAALADIVAPQGQNETVIAMVNTDQMQYAVIGDNALVIQFSGGEQNRLTINQTGDNAAELLQGWLSQLSGGAD
ncbi:hypothetical protein [Aestuariicoccus sp. MJ-SS9]|uniref:hypothetical protein n=1 Tax=Aestuariicoccus sp. MJ-SS9 TaxID=3079855 RepID=UPI002914BE9F|nr:hypothetical protein [Aestuariicoccus sp. MJ-SS9]MDU8910040.1 hypothetical protein [Aestuariicoccus sp. MJ-SS9]